MKILYGVNGEGMGHAMHAAVIAKHLIAKGHNVQFAVGSGRAASRLASKWPSQVVTVPGLTFNIENNRVNPFMTLVSNFAKHTFASPWSHILSAVRVTPPDVVISDFEPWSARYAMLARKPLISVDSNRFLDRCKHPREWVANNRTAAALMYPVVSNMTPCADRYMVMTFAAAPIVKEATSLHLPVLRSEVLDKPVSNAGHVVAYLHGSGDHPKMVGAFQKVNAQFRLYGAKVDSPQTLGNVTLLPVSEDGFMSDLASCKAVIGSAGFTTITEAVYLGKPMLAMPFEGHFDQILAASYLEGLGYGEQTREMTAEKVGGFLERALDYRRKLAALPKHDRNTELLSSLDRAILEVTS